MSALGDGEIAREARRIFRKLTVPGAHLRPDGEEGWRVVCRAGVGKRDDVKVSAALVDVFVRRGWISRAGAAQTYVLGDAGLGWFARAQAEEEPFASQHQLRRKKLLTDHRGALRRVTLDEGESPLARLRHRGLIGPVQFDAGEKLRVDFTLAGLMPRLGVDLAAPMLTRGRGRAAPQVLGDTVIAAKQRFAAAMHAVGPGLCDLLFDVCCHLRGLEDAERAKGWPGRSGRVVLGIALDRLADHYGMRVRGRARLRGWILETEPEAGGA